MRGHSVSETSRSCNFLQFPRGNNAGNTHHDNLISFCVCVSLSPCLSLSLSDSLSYSPMSGFFSEKNYWTVHFLCQTSLPSFSFVGSMELLPLSEAANFRCGSGQIVVVVSVSGTKSTESRQTTLAVGKPCLFIKKALIKKIVIAAEICECCLVTLPIT